PLPSSSICGHQVDVDGGRGTMRSRLLAQIQPHLEKEILGAIDDWTTPQPYPQKRHAYELPRDVQPPSVDDKVKNQESPPTALSFLPPPRGAQPPQCGPSHHAQVAPQSCPLSSSPTSSFESSLPSEKPPLHSPPTPRTKNHKQSRPKPSYHLTTSSVPAESSGGPVQNMKTDTVSDLPQYVVQASSPEQSTRIYQSPDASMKDLPSIPNEHRLPQPSGAQPPQCGPSDHGQVAQLSSSPSSSFESSLPSEKPPLHPPPTPRTKNHKQSRPKPSYHLTTSSVPAESSGGPVQNMKTDTVSDLPQYVVQASSPEQTTRIYQSPDASMKDLPSIPNEHRVPQPSGAQPSQCGPSDHGQVAPQSSPLSSSPSFSLESSLPSEEPPLHPPPTPRTKNHKLFRPQPSDPLTTSSVRAESSGGPDQNVTTDTVSDLQQYLVPTSSLEQTTENYHSPDASIKDLPSMLNGHRPPQPSGTSTASQQ
ncbi:hypothetical protein C0991_006423, partial [Blastosporella zonata]